MTPKHSHTFVEEHDGPVMYGMDRETDEAALAVYLQKFSDDGLLKTVLPRLEQTQMDALFDLLGALLRTHLSETEYHELFLKSE